MSGKEILARIACDIEAIPPAPGREITIGMTKELFAKLAPVEMQLPPPGGHVTLFGCRVWRIANRGLGWIVGYRGTAGEGNHADAAD